LKALSTIMAKDVAASGITGQQYWDGAARLPI
jgi:hypothetical protein